MVESLEYGLNVSSIPYDGINKYIRITDIDDSTNRLLYNHLTSPNIDLKSASSYLLKSGDILFARTGASVGKTYLYRNSDGIAYYAGFLIRARVTNKYDSEIIFQNTLTKKYEEFVKVTSQRSGQPGINAKEYSKFSIVLPNNYEEKECLNKIFKKIDNLISIQMYQLSLYRRIRIALLQKMFPENGELVPKIRFPDFHDNWEQHALGNLLTERNEKIPESTHFPLMSFVQSKGVIPKGNRYDRSFLVKENNKSYKKTVLGDFIYSSNNLETGSIGLNETGNAVISPVYSIFYSNKPKISQFIGILSHRKSFISSMIKYRQGVVYGQWRIKEDEFLKIRITIPVNLERKKIITMFENLNSLIKNVEDKNQQLKIIKNHLLRKLFI